MVDCTTNSYAHHRPIPPWTARTGRRDIARGRTYSRLGWGPGGVTDLHAARPGGAIIAARCPERTTQPPLSACGWKERKWDEMFFRLMHGILNIRNMGLAVCGGCLAAWGQARAATPWPASWRCWPPSPRCTQRTSLARIPDMYSLRYRCVFRRRNYNTGYDHRC